MGKLYINFLVIFALISATISPACAFMNGQWMEICSDVEIVTVFVPADGSPPLPTKNKDNCNFCFQFGQGNGLEPASITITLNEPAKTYGDSFYEQGAIAQFVKTRQSRAPPIFS